MRGRKRRYRELTWDQPDDEVGPSFRRKRRRPPWLLVILVVAAVAVLVVLRSRLAPGIRQFSIVARPTATSTVTPRGYAGTAAACDQRSLSLRSRIPCLRRNGRHLVCPCLLAPSLSR